MHLLDFNEDNLFSLSELSVQMDNLQTFVPENAPGTFITAGIVDGMTCASCHEDEKTSWVRCVGEAAEFACQKRPAPASLYTNSSSKSWPESLACEISPEIRKKCKSLTGFQHHTGEAVSLPEVICRGSGEIASIVMSCGCAAGPTPVSAAISGLREVVERHEAHIWWKGEGLREPVRDLTILPPVEKFIHAVRQSNTSRSTTVGLLNMRYGIHVIVALSFERSTKKGFVCATAAHHDLLEAARSAIRELIQLEWGFLNTHAKAERDIAQLSEYERKIISDADSVDINDQRLEFAKAPDMIFQQSQAYSDDETALQSLISAARDDSLEVYGIMLHNQDGLCVIKSFISTMILRDPVFS